ncbi:GNAT family N-acetyltransferase [Enterovibrio norvegicus FF-33]|uniref:GNAT family N-acetyltransferase n=1 Tax=Enterovibrio norvegicus TaxID=188144 RepID=UPI0002DD073E|nr:GNAT family N-acetyltransferase [Enterovibrio norvegicus]OEE66734.1 GNAT family N-acetyltransferase [Enterovibrio norvegicus FF-33]
MKIEDAGSEDMAALFAYLNRQLEENGAEGGALFQPLSRDECVVSDDVKKRFSDGVLADRESSNWRKIWLAKNSSGNIVGHIDLRHYADEHCRHRVLLGMGVDRAVRRQGLGESLLKTAIAFCQNDEKTEWLDLNVIGCNEKAITLYRKLGFEQLGEISDYYRIDGQSYSELTFTLPTSHKG